jgi:hypothetical protein
MKTLRYLCAALLLAIAGSLLAAPARAATLHAVLLIASPKPGPTDPRLAAYEVPMKRVLRFNSYIFQGSDTAEIGQNSRAELVIGQGHELIVETGENPLALRIRWAAGGLNTGITVRPGVPVVLGGSSTGKNNGEVYAVILMLK